MFPKYGADLERAVQAANSAGQKAMADVLASALPPAAPGAGIAQSSAANPPGRGLGRLRPLARIKPLVSSSQLFPQAHSDPQAQLQAVTGAPGQLVKAAAATLTPETVQAAADAYREAFTRAITSASIGEK